MTGNEVVVKDCQIDAQWAKSPAGIAITTKRAALFNEEDLRTLAADSKIAECIIAQGYKSVCSVPILSRDRSLGALNLGSERPEAFTTDDVELLGQVAQQIAIAVENGLAFREIAELKEKLSTGKAVPRRRDSDGAQLRRDRRPELDPQAGAEAGGDRRADGFDGLDTR